QGLALIGGGYDGRSGTSALCVFDDSGGVILHCSDAGDGGPQVDTVNLTRVLSLRMCPPLVDLGAVQSLMSLEWGRKMRFQACSSIVPPVAPAAALLTTTMAGRNSRSFRV